MVEMGDCYSVDRAITHLNNNFLFGQKLNVWYNHQSTELAKIISVTYTCLRPLTLLPLQRVQAASYCARAVLPVRGQHQQLQRFPWIAQQPLYLPRAGGQEQNPAPQQCPTLL